MIFLLLKPIALKGLLRTTEVVALDAAMVWAATEAVKPILRKK
jgi:hypothetical protein